MNKKEERVTILANWKDGDDSNTSREMGRMGIPVTKQAVRKWRTGETVDSKLDQFYRRAAKQVQAARATAARATN